MSKREKCTYEEKIKAVEDYLNGVRSQKQIAADLGLGKRGRSTVGRWVRRYQTAGPDALLPSIHNNSYSKEFKEPSIQLLRNIRMRIRCTIQIEASNTQARSSRINCLRTEWNNPCQG